MKAIVFLIVGIALLAGLFAAFKPAPVPVASPPLPAATAPAPSPLPAPVAAAAPPQEAPTPHVDPAGHVYDITVSKGRLAHGPSVIAVRKGDEVTLRITADVSDELHLHGYNRHLHLAAGAPATLQIVADKTGRFTYELHKSGLELGTLEVRPR